MKDETTATSGTSNDPGVPDFDKAHLVFVNDRERIVHSSHVTFEEVVALARDRKPTRAAAAAFHVGYTNGSRVQPTGSLEPGATVPLHGGMRFKVVRVDDDPSNASPE